MFSSKKSLEIIGYLLYLNGGKMNLLKLMKELYLIDRKSIEETNFSITGDVYFSMKKGPVLSGIKNLLEDLGRENNVWDRFLKKQETKYYPNIILIKKTEDEYLSEKDKEYIETISEEFKNFSEWQLVEYTHNNCQEWKEVENGSIKIRFKDIMLALGKNEKEIEEAKKEYDKMNELTNILNYD